MTWILTIVILLFLLLCWMLLSPLVLELDTASEKAMFTWPGIGSASLWHDGKWQIFLRVFFFSKKFALSGNKKHKVKPARNKKQKSKRPVPFYRFVNCLKTFRVVDWKMAIDTGDFALNAKLFPLNFHPMLQNHVEVNFTEKNYFYLKIRNYPWRMIYAFLR